MTRKMNSAAIAALIVGIAYAMPTRQEMSGARPLVAELMAPTMAEYKAKTKTAADVADTSVSFAESAKNEATRFLFLRGAISFYIKGGEYGKAADTVEKLKANVKDVPPAEIADVISTALGRENMRKSPRLYSQLQLAQAQVKAAGDVRRLSVQLKRVSSEALRTQYAEALALAGDWKKALSEFESIRGEVGEMAKKDADGTGSGESLGDFWWNYKTCYAGGELVFRERAANYYRKAIAAGKIDGLKKTLVVQRLASLSLPDVDNSEAGPVASSENGRGRSPSAPTSAQTTGRGRSPSAPNTSGLVHRWSFADGFTDSVGNVAPSKSDNAKVENGAVALCSGSPLVFPVGAVPPAPFTVQVWASATAKGLGDGGDFIFRITDSVDDKPEVDKVFWKWTGRTQWVSRIGAIGNVKPVGHGTHFLDGKPHLYTVSCEKDGKGLVLSFFHDDTHLGKIETKGAWKLSKPLVLGGFIAPTYDEVRVYSRAFSHLDVINAANLGPDKLPEGK